MGFRYAEAKVVMPGGAVITKASASVDGMVLTLRTGPEAAQQYQLSAIIPEGRNTWTLVTSAGPITVQRAGCNCNGL